MATVFPPLGPGPIAGLPLGAPPRAAGGASLTATVIATTVTVFDASGTFTPTVSGWYRVFLKGGGGGGAYNLGGAGGAGRFAYAVVWLVAGETYTVTIGAAGTGGPNGTTPNGTDGGGASLAYGSITLISVLGGDGAVLSTFAAGDGGSGGGSPGAGGNDGDGGAGGSDGGAGTSPKAPGSGQSTAAFSAAVSEFETTTISAGTPGSGTGINGAGGGAAGVEVTGETPTDATDGTYGGGGGEGFGAGGGGGGSNSAGGNGSTGVVVIEGPS
jgi:hypothetical protein